MVKNKKPMIESRNGVDYHPPAEIVPASERVMLLPGAASLARRLGKTHYIGVTTGAFDLIHLGHIRYIEALVEETYQRAEDAHKIPLVLVGLNSDESIRRNKAHKSENRPVQGAAERAEIMASLRGVDRTFVFDDNMRLVDLRPNLFQVSKSSDHPASTREELTQMQERWKTEILEQEPFASTGNTDLLAMIHEKGIR
jgi:cytidyltransferase-like protein